jgi:hypothetical protein
MLRDDTRYKIQATSYKKEVDGSSHWPPKLSAKVGSSRDQAQLALFPSASSRMNSFFTSSSEGSTTTTQPISSPQLLGQLASTTFPLIHRPAHHVQKRPAPVVPDGGSNLCQIRREYPNRLDCRLPSCSHTS